MSSSTTEPAPGVRRAYHGSCHCGHTKYITYITLPPAMITAKPPSHKDSVRLRKCNCSTCHKMSQFHIRLPDAPREFLLLSPLNPTSGGLSDYTCFDKRIHWYFCGNCGVRCFAFAGEGEVRKVEIEGEMKEIWSPAQSGWVEEDGRDYLSINAATLEPRQEGLDLNEWTEKGWICYVDYLDECDEPRLGKPHDGGMY